LTGIMLIVFRPFHIGIIETGGVAGTTADQPVLHRDRRDDNTRIIIPNGKLWGEIVRVPTRNDTARLDLRFPGRPATT
jgi:small conductance mechanosensitive channel